MGDKLIDAYYAINADENKFLRRLKNASLLLKSIFTFFIVGYIYILVLIILQKEEILAISLIIYVVIGYVLTLFAERTKRKNWENNISEYNDALNMIADLLKREEFSLYNKMKIKQMIHKIRLSIDEISNESKNRSIDNKDFVTTFIIPIVTFLIGRTNLQMDGYTIISILVVVLFIMIGTRYFFKEVVYLLTLINGNQIEKKKQFLVKLQDLLDRDFEINEKDLL